MKASKSDTSMFGRYTIKALNKGEHWQARAFRVMSTASDIETADTREEAVEAVKDSLRAASAKEQGHRQLSGFASPSAVLAALRVIAINANQWAMLRAHIAAPDRTLSAAELAEAVGHEDYRAVCAGYDALGQTLAEEMEWKPPSFDGALPIGVLALATNVSNRDGSAAPSHCLAGGARWTLRPQLVEALTLL